MEDALYHAGVHIGYKDARAKLARLLQQQDPAPTAEDIALLGRFAQRRKLNNQGAYLTKLLKSGQWKPMVDEIRGSRAFATIAPNSDPAAHWAKEGEVDSILDGKQMPCGCDWGAHKLGKRSCIKAG